jgi:hypothetical protein
MENPRDQFWDKERFISEKAPYNGQLVAVSFFVSLGSFLGLWFLHFKLLAPFSIFIGFSVFFIFRKIYFNQWKDELLNRRRISEQLFDKLASETKVEDSFYWKRIVFMIVLFAAVFSWALHIKSVEDDLMKNGRYVLGKIYKIEYGEDDCASVEFWVNGTKYTTGISLYYYRHYKRHKQSEIKIGDELVVRYSSKNPENNEVIGDYP